MKPIQILGQDGLNQIHEASLAMLERTGLLVAHAPSLERIVAHAARTLKHVES